MANGLVKIDFTTGTQAAPSFEGVNKGIAESNKQLRESLLALGTQAKEYGDSVTERNTQELLALHDAAKTPEEAANLGNMIRSKAETDYYGNVNLGKINTAIATKPASIMEMATKQNTLDRYDQTLKGEEALRVQAKSLYPNMNFDNMTGDQITAMMGASNDISTLAIKAQEATNGANKIAADEDAAKNRFDADPDNIYETVGNDGSVTSGNVSRSGNAAAQGNTETRNFPNVSGLVLSGEALANPQNRANMLLSLIGAESSARDVGNINLRNRSKVDGETQSTAIGYAQIIQGNFDVLASSAEMKELAVRHGRDPSAPRNLYLELLRGEKSDYHREAYNTIADLLVREEANRLNKLGVPANRTNMGIAWHLGGPHAEKFFTLLRTSPNVKMVDLGIPGFSEKQLAGQGSSKTETVQQFYDRKAAQAQKYSGSGNQEAVAGTSNTGVTISRTNRLNATEQTRLDVNRIRAEYAKALPVEERVKIESEILKARAEAQTFGDILVGTAGIRALDQFKADQVKAGLEWNPQLELSMLKLIKADNDLQWDDKNVTQMRQQLEDIYKAADIQVNGAQNNEIISSMQAELIKLNKLQQQKNLGTLNLGQYAVMTLGEEEARRILGNERMPKNNRAQRETALVNQTSSNGTSTPLATNTADLATQAAGINASDKIDPASVVVPKETSYKPDLDNNGIGILPSPPNNIGDYNTKLNYDRLSTRHADLINMRGRIEKTNGSDRDKLIEDYASKLQVYNRLLESYNEGVYRHSVGLVRNIGEGRAADLAGLVGQAIENAAVNGFTGLRDLITGQNDEERAKNVAAARATFPDPDKTAAPTRPTPGREVLNDGTVMYPNPEELKRMGERYRQRQKQAREAMAEAVREIGAGNRPTPEQLQKLSRIAENNRKLLRDLFF